MIKTFEIIRPKSENDSNYENFEYLIRWMGRDGAEYFYMFYDARLNINISGEVINSENDISTIIEKVGRTITLTANNLSNNDVKIVAQMFENRYVTRIKKDGTIERLSPGSNGLDIRERQGRYNITFTLTLTDVKRWK